MPTDPRELVEAVGAAAVDALEPLGALSFYVEFFASLARDGKILKSELHEPFNGARKELPGRAAALGKLLAPLRGWWVAGEPPAFAPRATSVAEGILHLSARLLTLLDAPGVRDLGARCLWANRHANLPDPGTVGASLECEVATMSRRPAPDPTHTAMWARVLPMAGRSTMFAWIYEVAQSEAWRRLPVLWRRMSEVERVAAIRNPPADAPGPRSDVPRWRPEMRMLIFRNGVARAYPKRAAPNQARLLAALEAAGWPATPVPVSGIYADQVAEAVDSFNSSVTPGTIRLWRSGASVAWQVDTEKER